MKLRNLKDVFVERANKFDEFREFLQPDFKFRILNIHSYGDGGIGKTMLLTKLIESCKKIPDLYYSESFIDFYHMESQTRLGIMRRISESLKDSGFTTFNEKLTEYGRKELTAGDRRDYEARMEEWFFDDLKIFSERCRSEGKIILLFFDNYEKIQTENAIIRQWFEELILRRLPFPEVFRIVIAGRHILSLQDNQDYLVRVREMPLEKFSYDEMVSYFKECYSKKELETKIGPNDLLKYLYDLVEGRPIFISLVVDWLENGNDFSLMDLLTKIGLDCIDSSKSKEVEITKFQKDDFKRALIEHIGKLSGDRDRAITYMAVAWRRMTPAMFSDITGVPLKDRIQKKNFDSIKMKFPLYEKLFKLHFENENDYYRVIDLGAVSPVSRFSESILSIKSISWKWHSIRTF